MAVQPVIVINGMEKAISHIKSEQKRIEVQVSNSITKATLMVEGEVKRSIAGYRSEPTSVDTGRFLGSIRSSTKDGIGTIWTDVKYAKYLEYGTSRMSPRYHFRNTLERNRAKIREMIAAGLRTKTI